MAVQKKLTKMFATLSATNEAILKSSSEQDLCQQVCDAAVRSGDFLGTAIFLVEKSGMGLRLAVGAGPVVHLIDRLPSADPSTPQGQGLGGEAFRTGKPSISDDVRHDPRTKPWWPFAERAGLKAVAVIPLLGDGKTVGLMYFFFADRVGKLDEDHTRLIINMSENVSFGMEMYRRDEQRNRLSRMFAALSATNEAIMRATTRSELFQRVCEGAVLGGNFTLTTIALCRHGRRFLDVVASAGPDRTPSRVVKLSADTSCPEGTGLCGRALRSRQPCISNDYLGDATTAHFHDKVRDSGGRSGAAIPLLKRGETIGVLLFFSADLGAFAPELVELLQRLADNISFGLDNFDRAEEKAKADEQIKYLATHDSLTDLPNRAVFTQLLNASIANARRDKKKHALLFVDLDRFKVINDTLGHADGDALLIQVASRLRQNLRDSDIVARLGADEFVILLPEQGDESSATAVARKLLSAVMQPVMLGGQECRVTASIGVALYPKNGHDEQALVKNAAMAMYVAKDEGKNTVRLFSKNMKTQSIERLMLETNLRKALERNEFTLHYQPKINLTTGRITGVEALLRWSQPDLGMLAPGQFIPLAEETGLIVPIGRWVLRMACEQHVAWQRRGMPPILIAVNLSPRQFQHDQLLQDIDDTLAATGMRPELLEIEVTESTVMQNVDRAIMLLNALKQRGILLAMDDFGTGYSSMSLIKRFPIDTLKIDRAFIRDLPDNNDDKAIASAIIGLGKALGVTIVAEGVETLGQRTFLRDNACDEMQGYLFSRPLPAEEMEALLETFAAEGPPLQPFDMNPAEQLRLTGRNKRGCRQLDRQSARLSRKLRLKSAT